MVAAVRDARQRGGRRDRRPAVACRLRTRPSRGSSPSRARARTATSSSPRTATARPPARCAASRSAPPAGSARWASPPRRAATAWAARLTEAAIARLHERGAGTVLLFATDMGRPLYERLGFVIEGAATAWRGTAGAIPTGVQVRRLREDDRAAVSELDRAATGEDRSQPARRPAPAARASPPSARGRSPAGRRRRPTAPASPSAPATTRPASR